MISGSVLSSDGTRSSIETLYYSTEAQDKNMNKTPFWLVFPVIAVLGLTACGGDDDGEKEEAGEIVDVVEEEAPSLSLFELKALPAVNTSLSASSPAGVWMLTSSESSTIPNEENSMNPFLYELEGREMVIVTETDSGIYELNRCSSAWRTEEDLIATDDGYTWTEMTESEPDSSGVVTTTTRTFDVSYASDNQTLSATGTLVIAPVGENLSMIMKGVKVSDSTDFNSASDLTFAYSLDYINLGNEGSLVDDQMQCLGAFNAVTTTEVASDVYELERREYTYFNASDKQVQYYRFDLETDEQVTRSLGAVINAPDVFAMLINSCDVTNTECMESALWEEDVIVNETSVDFNVRYDVVDNKYVINPLALTPFTAFLTPHDGDFFDSDIQASVNE
jgi:hypothetical protein